jgi:hypothetical protein
MGSGIEGTIVILQLYHFQPSSFIALALNYMLLSKNQEGRKHDGNETHTKVDILGANCTM